MERHRFYSGVCALLIAVALSATAQICSSKMIRMIMPDGAGLVRT